MRPTRKNRWRRCLKCDERFQSEGPHNRLCARCNRVNKDRRAEPSASPRWNRRPMRVASQLEPTLPEL